MTVTTRRRAVGVVLGAALATTAACSSSSSPTTDRAHDTIAYAERLLSETPVAPGEYAFTGTPPKNLASPDETIGVGDLVVRKRYWTAPGSADQVYNALENTSVVGLRVSGHGLPSLRAEDLPGRGFLNFELLTPPSFIQGGELYVEMESLKPGVTIIAAYAEVFAHPAREATEHITAAGATGSARWPEIRTASHNLLGKVIAHPIEMLSPDRLAAFIDAFNGSPLTDMTGGCLGGPFRLQGADLIGTIVANGTWTLTYPGACGTLEVRRNSEPLAAIAPDQSLLQLLEVLQHDDGTVTGRLLVVGGPYGAQPTPARGELTLADGGRTVAQIHTQSLGDFSLNAQPGRYQLFGRTPQFTINGHHARCSAAHKVTVRTHQTTHADVYCQRR